MKKLLFVLAIGAFLAACNNGTDTKTVITDSSKTVTDSTKVVVDTTAKKMTDTSAMKK